MTGSKDAQEAARERSAPLCPTCGRPRVERWRPFCSKRCADVDLGRWLKESYRIPAVEAADDEGDGRTPRHDDA
jgi:hypothetical protein